MAFAKKCDACGSFYTPSESALFDHVKVTNQCIFECRPFIPGKVTTDYMHIPVTKSFDVCPSCCEKIASLLNMKKS